MSKISAVRLININYNHNAIHISDEVMHFNGKSTLISLRNGGGKSVLVQMLTAPFVQKRYRNTKDRPFADFFTSNRPSFILVEWELDQRAGYVMVGMMVRRSQSMETADDLEMINFITEYKEPCVQDLHHIPVIEKTQETVTLKSFAICRQLFDTYKKDHSMCFFHYDMNNSAQSKQYFDKLMEYGINYREWQNIIKKVNEEESGLSKLFADCKDEKGLIEKWFLDTVENKLKRDKDRMQEFRNILEKYIALYSDNQSKIKQRDIVRKFDEEAVRISEYGEIYAEKSDAEDAATQKLASYLGKLNRILEATELEYTAAQEKSEEYRQQIVMADYQQYSAEYYKEQDEIDRLTGVIEAIDAELTRMRGEKDFLTRSLNLLKCAKQQEIADDYRADLAEAEEALSVCRAEKAQTEPEREYLGFVIYRHYELQSAEFQKQITESEEKLNTGRASLNAANDAISKIEKSQGVYREEKGRLESAVANYDREEERFITRWHVSLARNIVGEYEPGRLHILEENTNARAAEAAQERTQKKKRQDQLGSEIHRQERLIEDTLKNGELLKQKLDKAEQLREQYREELDERRRLLQYLELQEEALFDTDRILRTAEAKLSELDAIITRLTKEIADMEEQYQNMTTGRTAPVSRELSRMFESLGIHIVYGMEWLKKNGMTEADNLNLIQRHPFLPYALIMSEAELMKLKKAESSVYTSFPVPIVTRESLDVGGTDTDETALRIGSAHFYMLFNQNLLNEEKLAELLSVKERNIARKKEELTRRKQERDDYIGHRDAVRRQSVTGPAWDDSGTTISELRDEIESLREEYAKEKEDLAGLNTEKENLTGELLRLEKELDELGRRLEDLRELSVNYAAYMGQRHKLNDCISQLKELESEFTRLKAERRMTESRIQTEEEILRGLRGEHIKVQEELSKYSHFTEVARPETLSASVTADFMHIQARFRKITEQVSRQERDLEEERKRAGDRLVKSEKELARLAKKYGLDDDAWSGIHYSTAEEDHAEEEIKHLTELEDNDSAQRNLADKNLGLARQRQEQAVRHMVQSCLKEEPLPRADVPQIDFAESKKVLQHKKSEQEEISGRLSARKAALEQNITALAEYDTIEVKKNICWEEEFSQFSMAELRDFTGKLQRGYSECRKAAGDAKERLLGVLNRIARIQEFQEDFYKKSIELMIAVSGNARQVLKQLDTIQQAYHDLMSKLEVDISMVESEKEHIVILLLSYVRDVHEQIGKIDRNSSIVVHGRAIKMLKIGLPDWVENEEFYRIRVEGLVDEITRQGLSLLAMNEAIHEMIGKRLTTRELYDSVIGIGNVHIQLYKIEENRELQISWKEVRSNSGGEGFLSAFVILSSLLYYMRRDDTDIFADRNEGKVLLMDNPFAQTNAAHLLKPLMDVAEKNNTQLICLTGLGGDSIYNRFDNIYALSLVPSSMGAGQYLKTEHTRGKDPEVVTFARIQVVDDDEQMGLIF